ncbi:MAG: 16S rRNA (cytidine(1402)-2'-O)-methyltransferase [Zoogloeaceae bacterium]|jgi:16S rRNA (cytidine1402-2'-O)-methyltransferase|nr:16S rRNA (cytidine(1402)-2'-O)-methyltransferase [Zoogloeaceae bacterium]
MTESFAPLYVVPTPLGNLDDLSLRARAVLVSVAWVAAEDTRHTAPLLRHVGSPARLLAAHAHNEEEAAARILVRLRAGEAVALVSDAGTPAISDPGARIVAQVREAGGHIIPLPGPCAAVTALSAAGLAEARWLFHGFLPQKSGPRRAVLAELRDLPCALVFHEAPHRILESVTDMAAVLAPRTLVIARELTKRFESIHVLPLAAAHAWLAADSDRQRGEFTLIVSGATGRAAGADPVSAEVERVLRLLLDENLPLRQAAKLAAAITGCPKNAIYARALEWKG